jgi:hypothetical protein
MKDELKESSWNEDKKAQKGKRGFVKVPESEHKNKSLVVKVTEKQKDFLKDYCIKQGITPSDLVRYMLYNHLKDKGEDFSVFEQIPTNQMNLFD